MANLKSSKKDIRRTVRRTEANKPFKRNAEMLPKKMAKLVAAGKTKEAVEMLPTAVKAIDKAVRKKILHKNTAARRKSSLAKMIAAK
jgi:small subunit ribosomal protein S20